MSARLCSAVFYTNTSSSSTDGKSYWKVQCALEPQSICSNSSTYMMVADAVVAMSTNNDNSFRSDLWSACRMQTRHGKQLLIRTLDWSTPDDQVYYGDCSAAVANVTQIVLIKTEKWETDRKNDRKICTSGFYWTSVTDTAGTSAIEFIAPEGLYNHNDNTINTIACQQTELYSKRVTLPAAYWRRWMQSLLSLRSS